MGLNHYHHYRSHIHFTGLIAKPPPSLQTTRIKKQNILKQKWTDLLADLSKSPTRPNQILEGDFSHLEQAATSNDTSFS